MGKPKKTIPNLFLKVGLPEDLVARIQLELYSEVEGKIPFGKQQEFFEALVRKHYAEQDASHKATPVEHFQLSDEALNDGY